MSRLSKRPTTESTTRSQSLSAGHVQLEEHRLAAGVDYLGGDPFALINQHVGQSYTGTLGGEEPGDGGAYATGRAGHERCLTLQPQLRLRPGLFICHPERSEGSLGCS